MSEMHETPEIHQAPDLSEPTKLTILAVALVTLAMFCLSAFQAYVLTRARQNLDTARAGQEQPLQEAVKLRQRVEALAGRVAKLAEEGNVHAKAIVDNMKRQGVELKPPPAK